MPAVYRQYLGAAPAGSVATPITTAIAPQNPKRIGLSIQNTGANPLLLQFNNKVKGDGSDLAIAAGVLLHWHTPETCPQGSIHIGSVLGTTCAILEGNEA